MGGHGGLNILPQKRWNVYNFDNREKVRKDEEAAASEEQLKQDQSRRRDAEFRLQILRQANRSKRGFESHESTPQTLAGVSDSSQTLGEEIETAEEPNNPDSNHINLFEGWNGFQREGEKGDNKESGRKEKVKDKRNDDHRPEKKQKKRREGEESVRAVLPEDEIYRLGYGVAGKDAKTPWYLSTSFAAQQEEDQERLAVERRSNSKESSQRNGEMKGKKKSLQELREERLKRERQERERAQKLLFPSTGDSGIKRVVNGQNRAPYYNSGYGNARRVFG